MDKAQGVGLGQQYHDGMSAFVRVETVKRNCSLLPQLPFQDSVPSAPDRRITDHLLDPGEEDPQRLWPQVCHSEVAESDHLHMMPQACKPQAFLCNTLKQGQTVKTVPSLLGGTLLS